MLQSQRIPIIEFKNSLYYVPELTSTQTDEQSNTTKQNTRFLKVVFNLIKAQYHSYSYTSSTLQTWGEGDESSMLQTCGEGRRGNLPIPLFLHLDLPSIFTLLIKKSFLRCICFALNSPQVCCPFLELNNMTCGFYNVPSANKH